MTRMDLFRTPALMRLGAVALLVLTIAALLLLAAFTRPAYAALAAVMGP